VLAGVGTVAILDSKKLTEVNGSNDHLCCDPNSLVQGDLAANFFFSIDDLGSTVSGPDLLITEAHANNETIDSE